MRNLISGRVEKKNINFFNVWLGKIVWVDFWAIPLVVKWVQLDPMLLKQQWCWLFAVYIRIPSFKAARALCK